MERYYQEPNLTLYQGHALTALQSLPDESVDCCMTSPPFWGLRCYHTEPIVWGGTRDCEHEWVTERTERLNQSGGHNSQKYQARHGVDNFQEAVDYSDRATYSHFCLKCGAWKGELGLEPTIQLYISHLMLIFTEVKRVLKKTGTCWVNIADSYAGGKGQSGCGDAEYQANRTDATLNKPYHQMGGHKVTRPSDGKIGVLPKSLCAIPERFMLAMMDSGWVVRNDIAWTKRNCMPESCKDRFTTSWEHLYFFTRSRRYWFEQQFEKSTLIATNVVQCKYGQENLPSMQKESPDNGILSTQESRQSEFMVQGLYKSEGQSVEENSIRNRKLSQSSSEICTHTEGQKETQVMGDIPTKKSILEGIHAVAKGKRKTEEIKSIGIREGNKKEIFSNTQREDGLDSEITQETQSNDSIRSNKSRGLAIDTQKVQESLCLLWNENKETYDRPYNPNKQRWNKQQEQSNTILSQLQFNQERQNASNISTRNLRDVWEINTEESYSSPEVKFPDGKLVKSFAAYPEKLCETPILSGCPSMICQKCGKARKKIYERGEYKKHDTENFDQETHGNGANRSKHSKPVEIIDKGYSDCGCNAGWISGVVLDPFAGSGTTLAVAKKLGRTAIGIELNPDYCRLAVKRISEISIPMGLNF